MTTQGKPVGISDVATKAGVSVTTVSHVLSARRPVAEATRAKVLQVIDELGYRPNEMARSMRAKRTSTVALVVPDISDPFYTSAARGLQDTVRAAGYHCIVESTDSDRHSAREAVRQLLSRVDGMVVSGADLHHEDLQLIVDAGVPLTLLGADVAGPGFDVVANADFDAGAMAADHLIRRGCRRVAFVAGPQDHGASARRVEGYRSVVDDGGASTTHPELTTRSAGTLDSGTQCMAALLQLDDPPDGVVCVSDVVAIGAMYAVTEQGLRVPDDVAVIGFDDLEVAAMVNPKLTTMATASREHGKVAGDLLLHRIDDRDAPPRREVFPARLVARESA